LDFSAGTCFVRETELHLHFSTEIQRMHRPGTGLGEAIRIPARCGVAVQIARGRTIKIINTLGKQVVDAWAFNDADLSEFMSMEHSRASLLKLVPEVGDTLVTNRRRPILTFDEDTTPGTHDTLIAACDEHRYRQLGAHGHHDSCTDNLARALNDLGLKPPLTPSPLNLFMNVPVTAGGRLAFKPPTSEAGQYVTLRAEIDLVAVLSACPQDLVPVNDMMPTDVHFIVT
jgi:uncharacterized protein YcgI (DUF1989 family)